MLLWIRGLVALVSMGVLLQVDCGSLFTLTGCLPEFQPLFAALAALTPTSSEPTVLQPTTKATTSGIFLSVENNTPYTVEVTFEADGQTLIASSGPSLTTRYEVAPPDSNTLVTASTIDLDGSWYDAATGQVLTFVNGGLDELIDENGLTHVFNVADVEMGVNVLSVQQTLQRDATTNSVAILITTDGAELGQINTEARTYTLVPGSTGSTLVGSSVVVELDSTGTVVDGTDTTLSHSFVRQYPNTLQAVGERDLDPATGLPVQDFTYDPPPAEVVAGVDYQFGQTVTFRVNATTVSFVVSD